MTDFWIGSKEWGRWWDPEPATVLRTLAALARASGTGSDAEARTQFLAA